MVRSDPATKKRSAGALRLVHALSRKSVTAVAARLEGTGPAIGAAEITRAAHFFLRLGLVDGELAAVEIDAVHLFRRELAFGIIAERHESEAARAARHAIVGDVDIGEGAELTEGVAEIGFGGLKGHVSNIEFGIHCDDFRMLRLLPARSRESGFESSLN